MSLRNLKKMKERQGKKETLPQEPILSSEEEEEEENGKGAFFSQFSAEFDNNNEEEEEEVDEVPVATEEKVEEKKGKKKKKKKKGKQNAPKVSESKQEEEVLEEEEKVVIKEEVKVAYEESKSKRSGSCLKMEAKMLNAEREFNKLFKEFGLTEEAPSATPVEEPAGVHLSKKAKQRLEKYKQAHEKAAKTHKALLAHSDITKLQVPRIFTMRLSEPDASGYTKFTYDLSEEYAIVQKRFNDAQKSNNIMQLYEFLQVHYYHPEALLALSEFSRLKGSFAEATQLIERCVCVFEATWNFQYSPLKDPPNTRLDLHNSKLAQNFGEAIFRYIDVLGRKGCSRTALEYCKLLLSFSPEEDPYGALLIIDYYSLRAREYEYLIEFACGWFANEFHRKKVTDKETRTSTLLLLPNLLYSCALAKKMLNLEERPKVDKLTEDFAKVISLSNINDIIHLNENSLLIVAMIMYPRLVRKIITKIKGTGTSWDMILKNLKTMSQSKKKYYEGYDWGCKDKQLSCAKNTLNRLFAIYEEKAANCFSPDSIQNWMRTVATFLYDNFASGELQPEIIRETIRTNSTCPFFLDRYSHLLVLDFKDDLTTIPTEELNPVIENALFAPQQQPAMPQPDAAEDPSNPLALFFRSLFQ